jgi:hypothetical protein
MKEFVSIRWDAQQCRQELKMLRRLLVGSRVLKERDDILPLFKRCLHLSASLGDYHRGIVNPDLVAHEYDLFGDFSCDLVAGDSRQGAYLFVEFEDAAPQSIFVRRKGKASPEWAPRFERGFSQLVDWFYKLADMEKTDEYTGRFGGKTNACVGLLVVGRSETLGEREERRLRWRQDKVLVNSNKIHCVTFDQLHQDLRLRLDKYTRLTARKRRGK